LKVDPQKRRSFADIATQALHEIIVFGHVALSPLERVLLPNWLSVILIAKRARHSVFVDDMFAI
jgi:hypothetical protein